MGFSTVFAAPLSDFSHGSGSGRAACPGAPPADDAPGPPGNVDSDEAPALTDIPHLKGARSIMPQGPSCSFVSSVQQTTAKLQSRPGRIGLQVCDPLCRGAASTESTPISMKTRSSKRLLRSKAASKAAPENNHVLR